MAHILCVEDDPTTLELRRTILERGGHRVDVYTSALQAVEVAMSRSYDALITDWQLGAHTAQALIQAVKDRADSPVIVISAFVAEAFQSAEPTADLYLDKPVNPAELMEVLNVLLQEHKKQNQV